MKKRKNEEFEAVAIAYEYPSIGFPIVRHIVVPKEIAGEKCRRIEELGLKLLYANPCHAGKKR